MPGEEQYFTVLDGAGSSSNGGSALNSLMGASSLFMGGNPITGLIVGGLLAGNTKTSTSGGTGSAQLNTSGQVVGDGTAQGGTLSAGSLTSLPWWVWPVGALVCMAIIKKAA